MPSETDTPRRLPRAERERQILDVAHEQFSRHGFHAVTMDAVAARVGVTKPLLYAYWGNKERLYLACLQRDGERLLGAVAAAVGAEGAPADVLEAGVHAFFAQVAEQPDAFRVLFDETLPGGGEVAQWVAGFRARLVDVIAATLMAQLPDGKRARVEVQALSHSLLSAAEGLARWWLTQDELPAPAAADLLVETVTPGLRARTAPRSPAHREGDPA